VVNLPIRLGTPKQGSLSAKTHSDEWYKASVKRPFVLAYKATIGLFFIAMFQKIIFSLALLAGAELAHPIGSPLGFASGIDPPFLCRQFLSLA
jgi:hypothetical protein